MAYETQYVYAEPVNLVNEFFPLCSSSPSRRKQFLQSVYIFAKGFKMVTEGEPFLF